MLISEEIPGSNPIRIFDDRFAVRTSWEETKTGIISSYLPTGDRNYK